MGIDRRLYLVSSRPGTPGKPARGAGGHLRLVTCLEEPARPEEPEQAVSPLAPAPVVSLARAVPIASAAPHSLARPLGQRVLHAAKDVAWLAVGLLIGLRPNA